MRAKYTNAILLLAIMSCLAVVVAAGVGAYWISPLKIPQILWEKSDGFAVLMEIRFPRVALTAIVGAALAISGAAMQGLFRNPLADPGLIGVSGGAALGASAWIVIAGGLVKAAGADPDIEPTTLVKFLTVVGKWGVPAASFLGSAAITFVIWKIAKFNGRMAVFTLLMAGIAINSIVGAFLGIMTYAADEEQLRSLTFWTLGDMSGATWAMVAVAGGMCAAGMSLLLTSGKALNAMSLGESEAAHLGVSIESVKKLIVLGVALAVGAGVSVAGMIGFIGLIVPHLFRLAVGADHRWLLPGSALGGAMLLVLADLAARTVVSPAQLPIGVVTSLLGGPFFLWLLLQGKRGLQGA